MSKIIDFENFKRKMDGKKERQDTDEKIKKRLEEREKEIVSANIGIKTTQANLVELLKFIKSLGNVEFETSDLKSDLENPIIVNPEDSLVK